MAADATKYEEESDVSVEEDDKARNSCDDDESRGECLQTSTTEVDREDTSSPASEHPKLEDKLLDSTPSPGEMFVVNTCC